MLTLGFPLIDKSIPAYYVAPHMNTTHGKRISNMRLVLVSLIGVGFSFFLFSGCSAKIDSQVPPADAGSPSLQRDNGVTNAGVPNTRAQNTDVTVTAITHLMTIESDVAGRTTLPVYFNVELKVDSNNTFQLMNIHRQGTTRPSLPTSGSATSEARARICAENSAVSQENCDVDLVQFVETGVVVERLLGRSGAILRAEPGFSATAGGRLNLHFIHRANLTDSTRDEMADYPIILDHKSGQWLLSAAGDPNKATFSLMKLESSFSGLFATGVQSIQVGTSYITIR